MLHQTGVNMPYVFIRPVAGFFHSISPAVTFVKPPLPAGLLLPATPPRIVAFHSKQIIQHWQCCASFWDSRDWAQQPFAYISAEGQRWQMSLWQVKQALVSSRVTETDVTMAMRREHVSSGSLETHCSYSIITLLWICQLEWSATQRTAKQPKQ